MISGTSEDAIELQPVSVETEKPNQTFLQSSLAQFEDFCQRIVCIRLDIKFDQTGAGVDRRSIYSALARDGGRPPFFHPQAPVARSGSLSIDDTPRRGDADLARASRVHERSVHERFDDVGVWLVGVSVAGHTGVAE